MKKEYLMKLLKPLLPKYIIAIFIGLLLNVFIVGSTFISKFLLDNVLPSKDMSALVIFVLSYLAFYILKNITSFLKEFLFSKFGYKILYDIRDNIFSSIIMKFDFTSFSSQKQGYIITLFRDWINSISWFLSNILLNTITECILLVIGVIILGKTNIKMLCITIMILPIYGLLYFLFNSKIRKTRMAMMDKDAEVTQNLKESLDSIKEIRIFNTENIFIKKYNLIQGDFSKHGINYAIITSIYDSLANVISVLGNIVVLYYGGIEVFKGTMTIGTLISLNLLVSLLYSPIERIINFNRLLQVFKIEFDKLNKFMKDNVSNTNPKLNTNYVSYYDYHKENKDILLKLDKVSFKYEELQILKNIDLTIKKGCTYAVVGENGCGKSTLINIITGLLVPSSGNIFINGMNIHEDLCKFRAQIGYVPQDTFLLNDSIINNITFGRKNHSKYSIEELLNICTINNIMGKDSFDLNTTIGEKGNKLSGGQKQKVALCRALYTNPKLLIIDEGTCNTDSDSENRIIENIKKAFPEISILLVSHRLSTIKLSDEILVLKDCAIIEKGVIEDLHKDSSYFYKMFSTEE
ncbi:peptidase domain-containing ABC transporter [Hathewaya limosa]|uniref:ATP-binding cassette subfamily B protein n=1 Tax=Hathewaya limosa TaxID=1536 RepID=A0ABU0JT67_HATLI|nr:ABC transporter ATP-binding protein [Hathewaya limosa]MDQ0480287.1 ATP-binding cassette subfamily B protein [Hathewaya limosa]